MPTILELPVEVGGIIIELLGPTSPHASCMALTCSRLHSFVNECAFWERTGVGVGCEGDKTEKQEEASDEDAETRRQTALVSSRQEAVVVIRHRFTTGFQFVGPHPSEMEPNFIPQSKETGLDTITFGSSSSDDTDQRNNEDEKTTQQQAFLFAPTDRGFGLSVFKKYDPSTMAKVMATVGNFAKSFFLQTSSTSGSSRATGYERRMILVSDLAVGSGARIFYDGLRGEVAPEQSVTPTISYPIYVQLPPSFQVYTVGADKLATKTAALIRHYFVAATAMIITVSGLLHKNGNIEEAQLAAEAYGGEKALCAVPFILLVADQHHPEALSPSQMMALLDIPRHFGCNRKWAVFGCSLENGGLNILPAMEWLLVHRRKQ